MKTLLKISFGLVLMVCLAGCDVPAAASETSFPNPTALYATISARLTETASPPNQTSIPASHRTTPSQTADPVPLPSETLPPIETRAPETTPFPSSTSEPCNLAAAGRPFVDVTIPDGTRLMPEEAFSKTWRLVNAGSCPWTSQYSIVWFSGENFSAVKTQPFDSVVNPGSSIDITVDMVAPKQPGIHQSNWKLSDARGALFGIGPNGDAPFWVRIEVEQVATDTPTLAATPTPTATPAIAAQGTLQLELDKPVDLDTGEVDITQGQDLVLKKGEEDATELVPLQGAKITLYGMGVPMQSECEAAGLTENAIPAQALRDGESFCYRSSQGLPGFFRIQTLDLVDGTLTIVFQTWAIP